MFAQVGSHMWINGINPESLQVVGGPMVTCYAIFTFTLLTLFHLPGKRDKRKQIHRKKRSSSIARSWKNRLRSKAEDSFPRNSLSQRDPKEKKPMNSSEPRSR